MVGDVPSQLTRRLFRVLQRNLHDLFLDGLRDAVPELALLGLAILQPVVTGLQIVVIPAVKSAARNIQFG
jgi:hypothetical protein